MFDYNDYRIFIKDYLRQKSLTQGQFAQRCKIHTAYFSRVLCQKHPAHFSDEQLFTVALQFKLTTEESDFFLLLGKVLRAGTPAYAKFIAAKIQTIQEDKQALKTKIDSTEKGSSKRPHESSLWRYYARWDVVDVHLLLAQEDFSCKPADICKRLGLPKRRLETILNHLHSLELIDYDGHRAHYKGGIIQLREEDPNAFHHHLNWRLKAIENLNNSRSGYHFTAAIGLEKQLIKEIEKRFKAFIHDVYLLTKDSQTEATTHVCFDLF